MRSDVCLVSPGSSGHTDGHTGGHTDGHTGGHTGGYTDGYTGGHTGGYTDGCMGDCTGGRVGGRTSGRTGDGVSRSSRRVQRELGLIRHVGLAFMLVDGDGLDCVRIPRDTHADSETNRRNFHM